MTSIFPKRWCAWPAAASYVLLALAGCASPPAPPPEAAPALAEAKRDFTYQGQPIHPALVHLFDGSEADDGPTILAVDVREAQNDNQFSTPVQRMATSFPPACPTPIRPSAAITGVSASLPTARRWWKAPGTAAAAGNSSICCSCAFTSSRSTGRRARRTGGWSCITPAACRWATATRPA